MARYIIDSDVTIRGTFYNNLGQVVDPSVVRILIKPPNGTIETYVYGVDVEVIREATGVYSMDRVADEEGTWHCRVESDIKAVAGEGTFVVPNSHFK